MDERVITVSVTVLVSEHPRRYVVYAWPVVVCYGLVAGVEVTDGG